MRRRRPLPSSRSTADWRAEYARLVPRWEGHNSSVVICMLLWTSHSCCAMPTRYNVMPQMRRRKIGQRAVCETQSLLI